MYILHAIWIKGNGVGLGSHIIVTIGSLPKSRCLFKHTGKVWIELPRSILNSVLNTDGVYLRDQYIIVAKINDIDCIPEIVTEVHWRVVPDSRPVTSMCQTLKLAVKWKPILTLHYRSEQWPNHIKCVSKCNWIRDMSQQISSKRMSIKHQFNNGHINYQTFCMYLIMLSDEGNRHIRIYHQTNQ